MQNVTLKLTQAILRHHIHLRHSVQFFLFLKGVYPCHSMQALQSAQISVLEYHFRYTTLLALSYVHLKDSTDQLKV